MFVELIVVQYYLYLMENVASLEEISEHAKRCLLTGQFFDDCLWSIWKTVEASITEITEDEIAFVKRIWAYVRVKHGVKQVSVIDKIHPKVIMRFLAASTRFSNVTLKFDGSILKMFVTIGTDSSVDLLAGEKKIGYQRIICDNQLEQEMMESKAERNLQELLWPLFFAQKSFWLIFEGKERGDIEVSGFKTILAHLPKAVLSFSNCRFVEHSYNQQPPEPQEVGIIQNCMMDNLAWYSFLKSYHILDVWQTTEDDYFTIVPTYVVNFGH